LSSRLSRNDSLKRQVLSRRRNVDSDSAGFTFCGPHPWTNNRESLAGDDLLLSC